MLDFFDNWHEWAGQNGVFWREWYQGFLDGKPRHWELQRRVALIDDAIWEAGPEAVAEEIDRIKEDFLSEKTTLAEDVLFNEDTAKFHAVPREIANPSLLGATLSQVEDALEDCLVNASNGLHDGAREVKVLRRTVAKYGNDPQRIEMDLTSVHAGLTRQIVIEDLPPSEENLALQRALEKGSQAVRATHDDVAENRRILDAQKIAELTEEQKATLAEAQPILEEISEGQLHDDFAEDIPYILEPHLRVPPALEAGERNPVLAAYDEKTKNLWSCRKDRDYPAHVQGHYSQSPR